LCVEQVSLLVADEKKITCGCGHMTRPK
jgi:hypothetical protein